MASMLPLALPALLAVAAGAQTLQSTFATGNDGWTVTNSTYNGHIAVNNLVSPAPWDTTDGLPTGSLRIGDLYAETSVRAPAAFLGDRLAWFGGSIAWDIKVRTTDGVTYPAVWLIGASKTLVYDTPSPPVHLWQHVNVPLRESGWRLNGWQGPAASRGDVLEVLADLRGILVNTEWNSGPDDTSFDNFELRPPTDGAVCYGTACVGSSGRWPTTWLSGVVTTGNQIAIEVTDGLPGGIAAAFVGFGPANVPIFGCTAWITPSPTWFALVLDGSGAAAIHAVVPAAPPGPLAVLQSAFFDPGAPGGFGIALSNAVALTMQ